MILLADIDAAPVSVLRVWWRELPQPRTDEERDVAERLAIRAEALGLVDEKGRLK